MPNQITAKTLLNLLLARHEKDVCVPECKTGGSWTNSHMQKMDLWTMTRSWAKPKVTVYEIKVSRNDFLQDDKWRGYLLFGNEFYFVCSPGLIDKSELPDEAGLMVTSNNGTRLYTRKRAPYRDVTIPESVWRYLLMWRSRIDVDMERQTRLQYWQKFLENRQYTSELGFRVSRGLREMINEKIETVERENIRLKRENEGLTNVREFLLNNGISERMITAGEVLGYNRHNLQRLVNQAGTGLPEGLPGAVSNAISCLETFRGFIR
jgi:hypothetical protein